MIFGRLPSATQLRWNPSVNSLRSVISLVCITPPTLLVKDSPMKAIVCSDWDELALRNIEKAFEGVSAAVAEFVPASRREQVGRGYLYDCKGGSHV